MAQDLPHRCSGSPSEALVALVPRAFPRSRARSSPETSFMYLQHEGDAVSRGKSTLGLGCVDGMGHVHSTGT